MSSNQNTPIPSPAHLNARRAAALQVDRLIRAVRRDIRLGLMQYLDDDKMGGLIKQHRENTHQAVTTQRTALIEALTGRTTS